MLRMFVYPVQYCLVLCVLIEKHALNVTEPYMLNILCFYILLIK